MKENMKKTINLNLVELDSHTSTFQSFKRETPAEYCDKRNIKYHKYILIAERGAFEVPEYRIEDYKREYVEGLGFDSLIEAINNQCRLKYLGIDSAVYYLEENKYSWVGEGLFAVWKFNNAVRTKRVRFSIGKSKPTDCQIEAR